MIWLLVPPHLPGNEAFRRHKQTIRISDFSFSSTWMRPLLSVFYISGIEGGLTCGRDSERSRKRSRARPRVLEEQHQYSMLPSPPRKTGPRSGPARTPAKMLEQHLMDRRSRETCVFSSFPSCRMFDSWKQNSHGEIKDFVTPTRSDADVFLSQFEMNKQEADKRRPSNRLVSDYRSR